MRGGTGCTTWCSSAMPHTLLHPFLVKAWTWGLKPPCYFSGSCTTPACVRCLPHLMAADLMSDVPSCKLPLHSCRPITSPALTRLRIWQRKILCKWRTRPHSLVFVRCVNWKNELNAPAPHAIARVITWLRKRYCRTKWLKRLDHTLTSVCSIWWTCTCSGQSLQRLCKMQLLQIICHHSHCNWSPNHLMTFSHVTR